MPRLHSDEVTREAVTKDARTPDGPAGGGQRAVVTLPPGAAAAARSMAEKMGGDVKTAEVVRRGLMLLDLMLSLSSNEELVIRNKETGECDRIRFAWQTF